MNDDKGNVIEVGSTVQVLYIDQGRGAEMWMHRGEVVGFGRTRVKVQFPSRGEPQSIGPECLRVIAAPAPTPTEKDLRTAGRKVAEWTAERDRLICEAVEAGGSLRGVGAAAGISHTAVKFIAHGRPQT